MYWPIFSLIIMASWSVHEFFRYWPSYPYFSQLIGWFPPPSTTPSLFPAIDPTPSFSIRLIFLPRRIFLFYHLWTFDHLQRFKKNNIMYACTFLLACRVVSFRVLTFRFTLHICLLQWSFPSLLCFYWPITLLFTSELWSDINSSASAWFYIDRLTCLFILTASITRHSDAGLGGGGGLKKKF